MKRFVLFLMMSGAGLPGHAEDLLQVYATVLQNDPGWQAAQARHRAAQETLPQARSALLPSVTASASTRSYRQSVQTPSLDDELDYRVDDYSLELRQTLYDSSRLSQLRQSRHELRRSELELEGMRQNLMLRTASAYLELLAARETLDSTAAERRATVQQGELARRNYNVGAASAVDVHEADARLDQARLLELQAGQALQQRREVLRRLAGTVPDSLRGPAEAMATVQVEPADAEAWSTRARNASPAVAVSEQALEISRELVTRARRGFHPTVELVASHNYLDSGGNIFGFGSRSRGNQVGLEFEMPLYQGGLRASGLRRTRALREAAQYDLALAQQQAEQSARDAYTALQNAMAGLRTLKQALDSTHRALESTRLAYEKGARSGIDVLNSQREYFRTGRELARARYDYLLASLTLRAAAGAIAEADLAETNRRLTRDIRLSGVGDE